MRLASPSLPALLGTLTACLGVLPARAQGPCDWNPAAGGPLARLESAAVVVDDRLLLFGGFLTGLQATARVHAYDPAGDSWSALTSMPTPVTHAGFALDDRQVWIAGGFVGNHPAPVTAEVWSYDVDLNIWTARTPLPAPRGSGGLFRIGRDLHFVGGVDVDRDTDRAEHWVLDLDNPVAWLASDPLPDARNHFGCLAIGASGYVIGGQHRHDTAPQDLAVVHAWNAQTGWTQQADLPYPRSHFEPSVHEWNGRALIAGGRSLPLGWETLPEVLAFDPGLDQWSVAGYLPQPLIAPALRTIAGEFVLAGGGPTENEPIADTSRRAATLDAPKSLRLDSGSSSALPGGWCPDLGAQGGKPHANPAAGDIAHTDDDALYWSTRTGSDAQPKQFGYRLALADDLYAVRLHFAETYWGVNGGAPGGVGARVFDVRIEGQTVLDDLDLFALVGPAAALVRTCEVALGDGLLEIDFDASVDRPLLAALEILRVDDAGAYCVGAPNSVGAGAHIGWAGSLALAQNSLVLTAGDCPPFSLGLFLRSQAPAQTALFSGFLCVGAPFYRLTPSAPVGPQGVALLALDLTDSGSPATQILPGSTWHFQYWYRDGAWATANFSDGVKLTFTP